MILVELDSGTEELYKSPAELAAAIRRGTVGPNSRIYHRGSSRWLPITVHPEFRKAAAERESQPLPPLRRKQWTFLKSDSQEEQSATDSPPMEASSGDLAEPAEPNHEPRPRWRGVFGRAFRKLRM